MRSPTRSTRSLFDSLHKAWVANDAVNESRLLAEIAELRDPTAIPPLVGLLYRLEGRAGAVAAATIQRIADRCSVLELAQVDQAVRWVYGWSGNAVSPDSVVPVSLGLTGTLGILSFNGSGHVREAAVRALAASGDPQALPFLLIRVNDWATPVRTVAHEAVAAKLEAPHAAAFVACLPLIDRLKRQSRGGHEGLVQAMLDLLHRPECNQALRDGLAAPDRDTRRLAFTLLTDQVGGSLISILAAGATLADTTIRLRAARGLRENLPESELQRGLEHLLNDRFMPVRREALYGLTERLPEAAPVYLRAALLDTHTSIRDVARFHLRAKGGIDFATFYRERLHDGVGLAVAVAGLGETGVAADVSTLGQYLTHRDPLVRRSAVRAVARLDADGHEEEMFAALSDPSARVAKAAREVLLGRRHLLRADRLWAAFSTAERPHVRRIALSLIGELRWWDSAPLLVTAVGSADEGLRARAMTYLRRWGRNAGRLAQRPTPEQLSRLEAVVMQYGHVLDDRVRADVLYHLAFARRAAEPPS